LTGTGISFHNSACAGQFRPSARIGIPIIQAARKRSTRLSGGRLPPFVANLDRCNCRLSRGRGLGFRSPRKIRPT